MQGPLDPGSRAFGGDHWLEPYSAIRSANDLLAVIGTASALTAEQQNAVSGFAHTLQAYNFTIVLSSHTQDQIPIDVGTDASAPPAPFVTNAEAWNHVIALLDQAAAELVGTAFPFTLPAGFTGFNTPGNVPPVQPSAAGPGGGVPGRFRRCADVPGPIVPQPGRFRWTAGCTWISAPAPGDVANPLAVEPIRPARTSATPRCGPRPSSRPTARSTAASCAKLVTRPPRSGGTTNTDPIQQLSLGPGLDPLSQPEHADPAHQERGADPAPGRGQHRADRIWLQRCRTSIWCAPRPAVCPRTPERWISRRCWPSCSTTSATP